MQETVEIEFWGKLGLEEHKSRLQIVLCIVNNCPSLMQGL